MRFWWKFALALSLSFVVGTAAAAGYKSADTTPDPPQREFRGVWIATVHNIDWPSKATLPIADQKAEMIAILDRAVEMKLNAVVLQIRGECDALYRSKIEPWAPWLTGEMGRDPGYDPLEFSVRECHKRGIELHAWFNPFRAVNSGHGKSHPDHVTQTHPKAVRQYGKKLWLEPTLEFSRQRAIDVVRDVLERYDIDGVHIDDYFYPYPFKNKAGKWEDFNDYASYQAYRETGGELLIGDWRRDAMSGFVEEFYKTVKEIDPTCKVGVSPFGVYRPGQPAQVKTSLDAYESLYADVKKWWHNGWMDYLAPQLYWSTDHEQLGFGGLYDWWRDENKQGRHLWPGIAIYRIQSEGEPNRDANDALRQVKISRDNNDVSHGSGHIHYSVKSLMENRANLVEVFKNNIYGSFALPPASPWLSDGLLPKAQLRLVAETDASVVVQWDGDGLENRVRWWLVQTMENGAWTTGQLLPADKTNLAIEGAPAQIAVTPIGHAGELGSSASLLKSATAAPPVAVVVDEQN
ncbi:MAG: uncharacterized lipoprotein YddW (UPF0748 family) [Verrucomicrobiales bacterium]|jgi:uncharacterized lipoprotein YddW (UPF0748 family)